MTARPPSLLRSLITCLASLAMALNAAHAAAAPRGEPEEEWQLMYLDDAKVGFVHVIVEETESDGRPVVRVINDSSMSINRLGTSVNVLTNLVTTETLDGRIVEMVHETNMSAAKTWTRVRVDGDRAEITRRIAGAPQVNTIDWSPEWLGVVATERRAREATERQEKEFQVASWSVELGAMVTTYTVLGQVDVDVPGLGKQSLRQLRATIDVQPGMITDTYLDDAGKTVMTSTKMMGIRFVSVRSTKAACVAAFANPDTPEMFDRISPRTNVRLPDPYRSDEAVMRIRAGDPDAPLPALADERQEITEQVSKDELVLRVRKVVPDRPFALPLSDLTDYERECLEPNIQIESADPRLVALARGAIGDEKEAWAAACKLERFAYEYISNKSLSSLLETAVKVMETRAGDCTEHGVFLAGLCRAVGIPARVAVGFLYFQGIWGGHMWTEVSLGGKWYALDAVLGNGGVDAGHLRLAADSLQVAEISRVFNSVALGMTMKIDLLSWRHGQKEMVVGSEDQQLTIDGSRYHHHLFELSLLAPEGWTIVPTRSFKLGDNKLVDLDRPDGSDGIDVSVVDVTYSFQLDQVRAQLEATGMSRLKVEDATIDGRPAKRIRGKKEKVETLAAGVVRGQSLVLVTMKVATEGDAQLFEELLQTIDLDE